MNIWQVNLYGYWSYLEYADPKPNDKFTDVDLQRSCTKLRLGDYCLYHPGEIDHLPVNCLAD